MRYILIFLVGVFLGLGSLLTHSGGTAFAAEQIISPVKNNLLLDARTGTLIKLPGKASEVFVADPEIADVQVKSASLIYVFGRAPGETVIYAVSANGKVLLNRPILVQRNLSQLESSVRELLPEHKVEISAVGQAVVLSGAVATATDVETVRRLASRFVGNEEDIINNLAVTAPNQIHLRVRIAEVSRELIDQLGVNWDASLAAQNFAFGLATGSPVVGAAGALLTRNNSSSSLFSTFSDGRTDLNVLVDALEEEGLVSVLAEPTLTALSGETANFLAGGEFPIPVAQDDSTISIEFREFGVSLAFTPTLLGKNRINLKVRPEVSEISSLDAIQIDSLRIPSLSIRRAETTVELGSGQSFAIAGLIQQNTSDALEAVPGLGRTPVLGNLFRSNSFQRDETELLILVTPYIVEPIDADQKIALPTDRYTRQPVKETAEIGAQHKTTHFSRRVGGFLIE